MTRYWCVKVHRRGFFFRVAGYGLLFIVGGPTLYSVRKMSAAQPWRVWCIGPARLTVLQPSDLASLGDDRMRAEQQAPKRCDDPVLDSLPCNTPDCEQAQACLHPRTPPTEEFA